VSNTKDFLAGKYVKPKRVIMSIPRIPPWFMGWQTCTGCEKVLPNTLNFKMYIPVTEISVFAADSSLIWGLFFVGLHSGAMRRNCCSDIQDTEAPVSYSQVPGTPCVSTVMKGLYSDLELPITLICIAGKHLFSIEIASTKTVSPGRRSLLGAVPPFR
jgi:hypothetical protein